MLQDTSFAWTYSTSTVCQKWKSCFRIGETHATAWSKRLRLGAELDLLLSCSAARRERNQSSTGLRSEGFPLLHAVVLVDRRNALPRAERHSNLGQGWTRALADLTQTYRDPFSVEVISSDKKQMYADAVQLCRRQMQGENAQFSASDVFEIFSRSCIYSS